MDSKEKRLVFLTGLSITLLTLVPYFYGALTAPPGMTFLWGVGFLPDTLGKLSFVSQAADNSWLFINSYTSEPHPPAFFHPLFLALGLVAKVTGIFPGVLLQINRILFVLLLVTAVYALCKRLFADKDERLAAFFLVLLSGGPGFLCLIHPFFHLSADIRGAEMTTFFSMYQQGHFTAALFLLVTTTMLLTRAVETGSAPHGAAAGLSFLALTCVHPYDVPVMAAAGVLYSALILALMPPRERASRFRAVALFLLIPAPLVVYHAWVAEFAPVFKEFSREGLQAPPWPLFDYLLGYAPLIPLALLGAVSAFRRRRADFLFPAAWLVIVPLLMLLPLPARRKLMEGYHLFLCLLAALGVAYLRPFLGKFWRPVTVATIVLLTGSGLYVMARDIYGMDLSKSQTRKEIRMESGALIFPNPRPVDRLFAESPWITGIIMRDLDRYYVSDDLLRMLAWIRMSIPRDSVILSSPSTGMLVPIFAARRVFAGHIFETLRYTEKTLVIDTLMDPVLPDSARKILLESNGIGAILWDPTLKSAGAWRPQGKAWLDERAVFGQIAAFTTKRSSPVPEMTRSQLKTRIDACLLKARGRQLLKAGFFGQAARAFLLSLQIYPGDQSAESLLRTASRKGSPTPPRAGTQGTD